MPYDATTQGLGVAIAQNEGYGLPGKKPSIYNNPGDIKATWTGYPADAAGITRYPSINEGTEALNHQASLILNGSSNYNPNMTIDQAAAKYTSNGPNAGENWAKTLDPSGKILTKNSTIADYKAAVANGSLTPPTQLTNPASNGTSPTTSSTPANNAPAGSTVITAGDLSDRAATDFIELTDQEISDKTLQELTPDLVIKEGLDVMPWYQDQGLLTGNPRIRGFVAPVSFRMLVTGTLLFTQGLSGTPIEVQLNASVKTYSKTSKHVYHKTNTRTGMHVTLWGQEADTIEATGTTGVFMNQLGLTDFLSTSNVGDDLIQLLNDGFAHTFDTQTGEVQVAQAVQNQMTSGSPGSFRVAAQDAFVEFLSLFKSNGNVWFHKDNYTGTLSQSDQAGIAAWSPATGLSNQQGNARNNDVLTRGFIAMQLKESTYLGYFKSLSWKQDAKNPFQWTFNFVFKVERTISVVGYPR
jgi:hypothetical protein